MSDDDKDKQPDPPPEERSPDEPPPLDAGRLVEEVRQEVEHVAEEVREEVEELHEKIEDIVEHALPRRARWSAGRIAWMILLAMAAAIVLLIGGTLVYFTQNSVWAAGELQRLINQALAQQSNVVLEVRDLEGNPLKKVRLIEPRVRFRDKRGPAILEATSMTVAYTPWNLWIGRRRSIEITLDHPVVRLTKDRSGHWVLPEWRSGPRARGRPRELEVLLHLKDGTVVLPDSMGDVAGWSFDARALTGTVTQVSLQRMSWSRGPFDSRLDALAGDFTSADSVRFRISDLRTGDLAVRGNGGWQPDSKLRSVHFTIDRVRWRWLAKVFDNGVFDVAGEGHGTLDARGDSLWRGRLEAGGVFDSLTFQGHGGFDYVDGRFRMNPLAMTSSAGDLDGHFNYTSRAWDLGGDVRHGNPEKWGPIGLDGWPSGDLNGRMVYQNVKQGEDSATRLDAVLGPSELAGWRGDSTTVKVDFPVPGPDSFVVEMFRRGGRMRLEAVMDNEGWQGAYEATHFPLEEWPDGRASGLKGVLTMGRGLVQSRNQGLFVNGTLDGTNTEWIGLHAARWHVDQLDGALLPKPDLTGDARLTDLMYLGVHFDSAAAGIQMQDQTARLDDVSAAAGDTTLALAGDASWDERGWRVSLDHAEARSHQFHWTADPPLTLTGDAHGVDFERLMARDSTARLAIAGRWAGPGGVYDWTAHGERLDLARLGLPTDWGLSGEADATLHVTGRSGDPQWHFDADARAPGIGVRRVDSLALELDGRKAALDVKRAAVHLGGGTVEGTLAFERTAAPWPDTLTGQGVYDWLADAAHWQGEVHADSFALERLAGVVPQARGWAGRVSGTVAVDGRPRRPQLDVRAEARPLAWDSLAVESATARVHYKDERLEVPELKVTRGSIASTVSGTMPLVLAAGEKPTVPDAPMAWRVDLANGDLALLPLLLPQVAQARGTMELHATVDGTTRKPQMDGVAHVRKGVLVPAGREEVLEDIYADFRLGSSRITLDTLAAREGKRGIVRGNGVIDLNGAGLKGYRIDLGLRDFTALESGTYAAEFNANLAVTNGARVNGHVIPQITGDVDVNRAVILFDFANQSETQKLAATTQPLFWTYRIHLRANSNLRWQPPDGDLEFNADLTLEQTPAELIIFGDMHEIRGTYHFLSNRFTVNTCDLTFDNVGGVNPVIDASAVTQVTPTQQPTGELTASSGDASRPIMHTVTVNITGRANQPVIEFETVPADWDEPRILQELTVGRFIDKGQVALTDPLDNYITRKLNDQLSASLSKAFLGYVNQWALEREQGGLFAGQGDVMLRVSSQVNPQLQISYSQVLPGLGRPTTTGFTAPTNSFTRDVEAEYRINRFFYVTTELAQRRPGSAVLNTGTAGTEFNVNLKARWEY